MCVAMLASPVVAGWDTNAWPSYDHPRQGKARANNCYSASVERAIAADNSLETLPQELVWYRFQRGNLVQLKFNFKKTINNETPSFPSDDPFIDVSAFDTNETFDTYFSTNQSEREFPLLTVEALYDLAGIPTNYFEYTPWRYLSGLGPFTNDTTVGHGHGRTNAYTALGGTNFPGSRTNWYTTDYGWQGLKDALDLAIYTHGYQTALQDASDGIYGGDGESNVDWADAVSLSDADYGVGSGPGAPHFAYGSRGRYEGNTYHADMYGYSREMTHRVRYGSTNVPRDVQFYVKGEKIWGSNGTVYTNWGDPVIESHMTMFSLVTNSATEYTTSSVLGSISTTPWCAAPAAVSITYTDRGYMIPGNTNYEALVNWDFEYD